MGGFMKAMANAPVTHGETEASNERHAGRQSGHLPEACIAAILKFNSRSDVSRLACTNRTFRDASRSDTVWQKMLPAHYEEILAQVSNGPPTNSSKKEIYDFLCCGCFFQNDTQEYWLDRASGGVCRSVGARALQIVSEGYLCNWTKIFREGSRYPEVAYLKEVIWLEIRGSVQCHLPPGEYVLSWRVYIGSIKGRPTSAPGVENFSEWGFCPVKFTFEANSQLVTSKRYLTVDGKRFRGFRIYGDDERDPDESSLQILYDTWTEIPVGEFTVEEGDSTVELSFSMMEIEKLTYKPELSVDCVLVRPTSVRRAEPRAEQHRQKRHRVEQQIEQQQQQRHHVERPERLIFKRSRTTRIP